MGTLSTWPRLMMLPVIQVPPHESGVRVVVSQKVCIEGVALNSSAVTKTQVRRLLRLDWGPDGLAYEEPGSKYSSIMYDDIL